MNRFLRDYKLIITTNVKTIEITPPLHIEFDCEKSINTFGLNRCNLKIYNLTESKRNLLIKDKEETKYINVKLYAGYEGNTKLLFQGNVSRAYSDRNGADLITFLECLDGLQDVQNSFTAGNATTKKQAVELIIKDMENIEIGKITDQNKIYRNKVIMGNSYEELKKLLQPDELMYIDNEKLYIIKSDEITNNYAPIVSAETGMIGIPKRENQIVEVSTIINPSIVVGGLVSLESQYAEYLNGLYRVDTSTFKGGYDSQDWTQSLRLKQHKGE